MSQFFSLITWPYDKMDYETDGIVVNCSILPGDVQYFPGILVITKKINLKKAKIGFLHRVSGLNCKDLYGQGWKAQTPKGSFK